MARGGCRGLTPRHPPLAPAIQPSVFHVLDVMLSAQESASTGQYLEIGSTVTDGR